MGVHLWLGQNSERILRTPKLQKKFLASWVHLSEKNCELEIDVDGVARWHLCHFTKQEFSTGNEVFLITIDIHERKIIENELLEKRSVSD